MKSANVIGEIAGEKTMLSTLDGLFEPFTRVARPLLGFRTGENEAGGEQAEAGPTPSTSYCRPERLFLKGHLHFKDTHPNFRWGSCECVGVTGERGSRMDHIVLAVRCRSGR